MADDGSRARAQANAGSFADVLRGMLDMYAGLARGATVGTLGAPGDIESLLMSGARYLGAAIPEDEQPLFPTSERVSAALPPLRPLAGGETNAYEQLGQNVQLNPLAVGRGAARALAPAADALASGPLGRLSAAIAGVGGAAGDAVPGAAMAIKPKGGNWLGSPKTSIAPISSALDDYLDSIKWRPVPAGAARHPPQAEYDRHVAAERWVDKQLNRYIMTDMGTVGDPLLEVEREGRLHIPQEQLQQTAQEYGLPAEVRGRTYERARYERGTPRLAANPYANEDTFHREATGRGVRTPWERVSEFPIRRETAAGRLAGMAEYDPDLMDEYPWLQRLAEKEQLDTRAGVNAWSPGVTPIYDFPEQMHVHAGDPLGFGHMVDYLRQSDLTPEQISRMSVPDVARRTHQWNETLRKQQQTESLTEGVKGVYKEYPEGMRWVELGAPAAPRISALPEGYTVGSHAKTDPSKAYAIKRSDGTPVAVGATPEEAMSSFVNDVWPSEHSRTIGKESAEKGLKAEGEVMGHCVGGYCEPVLSGDTRILSLRDADNQPHVTVELRRPGAHKDLRDLNGDPNLRRVSDMTDDELMKAASENTPGVYRSLESMRKNLNDQYYHPGLDFFIHPSYLKDPAWKIVQIKGKGNAAPADRYKPYAQDLVRSGSWHPDVGDLRNTGLQSVRDGLTRMIGDLGGADLYDKMMGFERGKPFIVNVKSLESQAVSDLGEHATAEEMKAWIMRKMED